MSDADTPYAVHIFCGALGQGLSDDRAIKHAAFWADHPEHDLRTYLAKHYPHGFSEERRDAERKFQMTNSNRDEVFKLVDEYIANRGLSVDSQIALLSGITVEFALPGDYSGRSASQAVHHYHDRIWYHKRRKKVGFLGAFGRGRPVAIEPRHLQIVASESDGTD